MIRAGTAAEANRHSGEWVFVDLGFAEKAKSCGLLLGNGEPDEVSFSQLKARLLAVVASDDRPLNLLIEAPLSVAFNEHGNPTGRGIEKRESQIPSFISRCRTLTPRTRLLLHAAPQTSGRHSSPQRCQTMSYGLGSYVTKMAIWLAYWRSGGEPIAGGA